VPDLLLVMAGDLPDAAKGCDDPLAVVFAGLDLEDLLRRVAGDLLPAVLVPLPLTVRVGRAWGQADAVPGAGGPPPLLFAVLLLVMAFQFDLEGVLALREGGRPELEPGDFSPVAEGHQVGGQVVGLALLPGAAVDPPVEGGTGELVADAGPDLVVA